MWNAFKKLVALF